MKTKPSYYVSKATLLLTAAIVWLIAGVNVFIVGIQTWILSDMNWLIKLFLATLTFMIFFFAIFSRLHKKYTQRILSYNEKNHPLAFFDARGWFIMAFMMGLGFSVRKFNLLPNSFIAPFYTGLSIALSLTGTLFIKIWINLTKK